MAGEVQKIPKAEEVPTIDKAALPASSLPPWVISARKWGLAAWNLFLRQREISILIIAILLVIYFQSANSVFLSRSNLVTLGQFIATTAIIAAGEVMLLICGEIDLSVGQVFA